MYAFCLNHDIWLSNITCNEGIKKTYKLFHTLKLNFKKVETFQKVSLSLRLRHAVSDFDNNIRWQSITNHKQWVIIIIVSVFHNNEDRQKGKNSSNVYKTFN